jgi:hypothetical protein
MAKEKKVRMYIEITYYFKKLVRHISVASYEAKDNFMKNMEGIRDFKLINWGKYGKRKGENIRYW